MATEIIYRKNPRYGQPGEPEMLPPETVEHNAATFPRVLSKTAFQDYVVSQLGGGETGMARFSEVMDATRDSSSGAVRFAYARYQAAQSFEKANTATLTKVMSDDLYPGHLTTAERDDILDNWPTA